MNPAQPQDQPILPKVRADSAVMASAAFVNTRKSHSDSRELRSVAKAYGSQFKPAMVIMLTVGLTAFVFLSVWVSRRWRNDSLSTSPPAAGLTTIRVNQAQLRRELANP